MVGKKLGHYEIQSKIGEGGMGEVYRARDTRLDRTVAVKVLPPHLSNQPELRERFEREARTISSLNHPNICTLFDVGRQDEIEFLVMEYLEGETLADRLKKGPLPIDQAFAFAIAIADALDKAHRQGVVHRDLKPGNIMLTPSGPKLLDFGLAKVMAGPAIQTQGLSQVPTAAALTVQGTILGTLQYMPPEQLEGQETDVRADIFSFGTVLYEMVTGRAAFQGKSQVTLISAIVSSEPAPASTLRAEIPPLLDHVIERCLAKEPNERWQTASDLLHELKWVAEAKPSIAAPSEQQPVRTKNGRLWMALSAVLALMLVALVVTYLRMPAPESIPMRLSVIPPTDTILPQTSGAAPWPTLSPDGRRMVFGAVKDTKLMLYLRSLDSETSQPLSGTDDGEQPFWSPDGRFIAFFAQNKLKKIDTLGGAPQVLCNVPGNPREGTWGADDTIVFAMSGTPLWRVSAAGGEAQPLTEFDKSRGEASHMYPSFLPDGRHFVFLAGAGEGGQTSISVGDLNSKSIKHLLPVASKAQYAAPGYLLYVRESSLVAQPFNADRLELSGQAFPIVENIRHTVSSGIAAFSVANSGTIAYRTGDATDEYQIVWLDRAGHELGRIGTPGIYINPEISPDGKQVAVERITDGNRDIWLLELARGIFNRFTTDRGARALWSADGDKIILSKFGKGALVQKSVNGATKEEVLAGEMTPEDLSPDGKALIYSNGQGGGLWVLPLEGDRKPHPLVESRFSEMDARFSPNGRWLAYESNDSGRLEIYARSYPANENKIQISTNGGSKARWSRDGKEIFYMGPDDKVISVTVSGDKRLEVGAPQTLFGTSLGVLGSIRPDLRQQYDVTADGKRFIVLEAVQTKTPPPITVFSNWQATAKR